MDQNRRQLRVPVTVVTGGFQYGKAWPQFLRRYGSDRVKLRAGKGELTGRQHPGRAQRREIIARRHWRQRVQSPKRLAQRLQGGRRRQDRLTSNKRGDEDRAPLVHQRDSAIGGRHDAGRGIAVLLQEHERRGIGGIGVRRRSRRPDANEPGRVVCTVNTIDDFLWNTTEQAERHRRDAIGAGEQRCDPIRLSCHFAPPASLVSC
jgi:hypothetical protein